VKHRVCGSQPLRQWVGRSVWLLHWSSVHFVARPFAPMTKPAGGRYGIVSQAALLLHSLKQSLYTLKQGRWIRGAFALALRRSAFLPRLAIVTLTPRNPKAKLVDGPLTWLSCRLETRASEVLHPGRCRYRCGEWPSPLKSVESAVSPWTEGLSDCPSWLRLYYAMVPCLLCQLLIPRCTYSSSDCG
jgi:hypothetical protein